MSGRYRKIKGLRGIRYCTYTRKYVASVKISGKNKSKVFFSLPDATHWREAMKETNGKYSSTSNYTSLELTKSDPKLIWPLWIEYCESQVKTNWSLSTFQKKRTFDPFIKEFGDIDIYDLNPNIIASVLEKLVRSSKNG